MNKDNKNKSSKKVGLPISSEEDVQKSIKLFDLNTISRKY